MHRWLCFSHSRLVLWLARNPATRCWTLGCCRGKCPFGAACLRSGLRDHESDRYSKPVERTPKLRRQSTDKGCPRLTPDTDPRFDCPEELQNPRSAHLRRPVPTSDKSNDSRWSKPSKAMETRWKFVRTHSYWHSRTSSH